MSDSSSVLSSSSSDTSSSSSDEDDLAALVVAEASLSAAGDSHPTNFAARLDRAADRIQAHDGRRHAKRVKKRRKFDPMGALQCIWRDFLGPQAIFLDDFPLYFRISRSRFEKIMVDVGRSGNTFFNPPPSVTKQPLASMQARLLLPLKTLAYGVAMHCFCPYFSMSKNLAITCCREFDKIINALYKDEWMRCPTKDDLQAIFNLHHHQHGVSGMIGSLDCSQTYWKNCPKAWHGQYKTGKEKKPSIVLEALCDYNCFFWHSAYGYAGSLSDDNVLYISPLMEKMLDGSFSSLESDLVPFQVAGESFHHSFCLTDGIYPLLSRFAKPIKQPMIWKEKRYTAWQEGARKSIERAFGILKEKFKWVENSIQLFDLQDISMRMSTCLILHNMCVSERIMGNPSLSYKADFNLTNLRPHEVVENPEDLEDFDSFIPGGPTAVIGIERLSMEAQEWILNREKNWKQLVNAQEHCRLLDALQDLVNSGRDDAYEAVPQAQL